MSAGDLFRMEARRETGATVSTDLLSALAVGDGFSLVLVNLRQRGNRRPRQDGGAIFHGTAEDLDDLIGGLQDVASALRTAAASAATPGDNQDMGLAVESLADPAVWMRDEEGYENGN